MDGCSEEPGGKLRFPDAGNTTKTLALKKDGTFETFEISGQTAGTSKNDAAIEVRMDSESGKKLLEKKTMVFQFEPSDTPTLFEISLSNQKYMTPSGPW